MVNTKMKKMDLLVDCQGSFQEYDSISESRCCLVNLSLRSTWMDYYYCSNYYGYSGLSLQSFGVGVRQRIIIAISVPVIAILNGVAAEEPSNAGIIVAMAQKMQAAVTVTLILRLPHKPERRRRTSRPADRVAERIIKLTVRHRLRAVRDTSC